MERHEMAEKLVEKCGISYEEAGAVLKEADYDLLEAMIILERRGFLGNSQPYRYSTGITQNCISSYDNEKSAADAESITEFLRIAWKKICEIFKDAIKYHIIVSKNGKELVSFPLVLAVVLLCFTAGLAIAAVVIAIVDGCSITIKKI